MTMQTYGDLKAKNLKKGSFVFNVHNVHGTIVMQFRLGGDLRNCEAMVEDMLKAIGKEGVDVAVWLDDFPGKPSQMYHG